MRSEWRALLTSEYQFWNKANGLALGSADEHLHDENLTAKQRAWLPEYCRRWNAAESVKAQ